MSPFQWREKSSEIAGSLISSKARSHSRHVLTLVPDGINGAMKRPVEQLTAAGGVAKWFPSISHAAREMGVSKSSVQRAITGRTKTCCGHSWRYAKSVVDPAAAILRDRFGGAYSRAKQGDA